MREQTEALGRAGVRARWRLSSLLACLTAVLALGGCTKPQANDDAAEPDAAEHETHAAAAGEHAEHDKHAEHAAHADHAEHADHAGHADHADVDGAVAFIQSSASVRQNAARACRQMYLCTYFKPANRGGEQGMILSAPEDAKDCLESRNPECEGALDQVAKLNPPKAIRTAYMQWAHNADELELQASRTALELLQQKKLKVKKEGDGYQDFWTVWAAKHFPSESSKALDMNARAEVMRAEGVKGLEAYLSKRGACAEGAPCTPMAVEKGEGLAKK